MKNTVFSGTAQIEIQGPAVLEFVFLDDKQAEFEIIGLTDPVIRIIDSRPRVHNTMRQILQDGKVETMADEFNTPARVTILPTKDEKMVVQLEPTRSQNPRHMLWVAVGIGEEIPYYDYKRVAIQQMEDKKYSLFSLYKRPKRKIPKE
jgi:hypothetical protein